MEILPHDPREGDGLMNIELQDWWFRGTYHETCASEGHCPYYFGRDKEGGCRYFMVFRVTDGGAGDVDLSGIVAVYVGDLPHSTYAEVVEKGSEGAVYVSDTASPEQRSVLDTLALEALGGVLMKKVIGLHYVPISFEEDDGTVRVTMPAGEMTMALTKSHNGEPVRLENATLPFLSNVKAAHTPYWTWADHDKHFEYRNRCGTWADFAMASE
jgi:hypothetical protein